jgi:hypothetical protein
MTLKPSYWIAICAILGAVFGYFLDGSGGWLGAGTGAVLGILVGAILSNSRGGRSRRR